MINNSSTRTGPALVDEGETAKAPSKRKSTTFAALALAVIVASLTGSSAFGQGLAGKYTGGGFIDSTAGGGKKATFGFNLEALDRDGDGQVDKVRQVVLDPETGEGLYRVNWWLAKGEFNYNDQGAGVSFHTDINETLALDENNQVAGSMYWLWIITEDNEFISAMVFEGPYTSRAGSGRVQLIVTAENDQFGVYPRDSVRVYLTGGPYDGYANAGYAQGGDIQWHPAAVKTK